MTYSPRDTRAVAAAIAEAGLIVAGFAAVIFGLYVIIAMVAAFQAPPT